MSDIIEEIEENVEKAGEAVEEIFEKVTGKAENEKKEGKKGRKKKEPSEKEVMRHAEKESLESEGKSIEQKKKELLERAKKLSEKVETATTEELKEQVKAKKKADMLINLEDYVKSGIYIGTKVVTPDMRPFVYRRRADGLAIFNTDLIDDKLKEGIEYLSKFSPESVILVCKRQVGWETAKKFSEITGIRVFTKKYPAGILTNTQLPDFFENELTIVTDSWLDKNALSDTLKVHKKILMICDTNNVSKGASQIIIGNNKSAKSLGLIFYLLTRGYCKARNMKADIPEMDWWVERE
ncbi:MAG: hypothetical protein ABIH49_02460 [archaeon]